MNKKEAPIKIGELDLQTKVAQVKRVVKVVKGGRVSSFSALVIVGNMDGVVGIGYGKAKDVSQAVAKATSCAKKRLCRITLLRGTIPHAVTMTYEGSSVLLKPAARGKGVIAGGIMRMVLERAGVANVLAKQRGRNACNIAEATVRALQALEDPIAVARRRGVTLDKVFNG